MYKKAYGIIETFAPLHTGATAGEESGNLNLILRDQFTQTGIVAGSSIRGRLRAEMRSQRRRWEKKNPRQDIPENLSKQEIETWEKNNPRQDIPQDMDEKLWYGRGNDLKRKDNPNYESIVKIEYASVIWLPVFCPGQPIVWVSCPRLLERYKRIADITAKVPDPYTGSQKLQGRKLKQKKNKEVLFFNLGFLTIKNPQQDLSPWFPLGKDLPAVVVDNKDIAMIHDMALYRQSRVALEEDQKVTADKAFFNVEALPEGTLLAFPLALKETKDDIWSQWQPFNKDKQDKEGDIYLGGLESVGFGHCYLKLQEVKTK